MSKRINEKKNKSISVVIKQEKPKIRNKRKKSNPSRENKKKCNSVRTKAKINRSKPKNKTTQKQKENEKSKGALIMPKVLGINFFEKNNNLEQKSKIENNLCNIYNNKNTITNNNHKNENNTSTNCIINIEANKSNENNNKNNYKINNNTIKIDNNNQKIKENEIKLIINTDKNSDSSNKINVNINNSKGLFAPLLKSINKNLFDGQTQNQISFKFEQFQSKTQTQTPKQNLNLFLPQEEKVPSFPINLINNISSTPVPTPMLPSTFSKEESSPESKAKQFLIFKTTNYESPENQILENNNQNNSTSSNNKNNSKNEATSAKYRKLFFFPKNNGKPVRFMGKKRGKKKSNFDSIHKHDKMAKDNIIRKLQVHYISFLINFVNFIITKLFPGDFRNYKQLKFADDYLFKKLNHQQIRIVNKSFLSLLKSKTIGEILCNSISPIYRRHKLESNYEVYDRVVKELPEMKKILNLNYLDLFEDIYHKNNRLIDLSKYGINMYVRINDEVQLFEDIVGRNTTPILEGVSFLEQKEEGGEVKNEENSEGEAGGGINNFEGGVKSIEKVVKNLEGGEKILKKGGKYFEGGMVVSNGDGKDDAKYIKELENTIRKYFNHKIYFKVKK